MTIISTTVGKNPLEEMESSSLSTKESELQCLDAISKMTEWSVCFQGKSFNITVIQVIMTGRPWTLPDGQHWNQTDYILCSKRGEALHSQQKQDWELTVAQIMNSLLPNSDLNRKVGKPTRPFVYDLNQIPYDYTVEVTNSQGIRPDRQSAWRTTDRG